MGQKVTVGGDRVGSGKKMQTTINDYRRSTHNLSQTFASSMGAGILYPALVLPCTRGDSFDLELNAAARTIPTKGPLFGSFKMQVDVYQCPVRLYQGILHNNPLAIGLKMSQVLFPMLKVMDRVHDIPTSQEDAKKIGKFNNSSLLKYLGMSGLGQPNLRSLNTRGTYFGREINAIPALAYFDIFKTYYANKQEDYAWQIIGNNIINLEWEIDSALVIYDRLHTENCLDDSASLQNAISLKIWLTKAGNTQPTEADWQTIIKQALNTIYIKYTNSDSLELYTDTLQNYFDTYNIEYKTNANIPLGTYEISFRLDYALGFNATYVEIRNFEGAQVTPTNKGIKLQKFPVSNIDDMRYDILSNNRLGDKIEIINDPGAEDDAYAPYKALVDEDVEIITIGGNDVNIGRTHNAKPLNGLVVKTYQNDIFNNWLNAEWIEGENGINELSKVAIVDGAFSMDSLNFATKLYNMLNRVAVAGGTYEDWQDVMYEEVKRRQIESPIFCGGMSQEVIFDEIVQTAPAEGDPLGTLGGRGKLIKESKNGGKIHIKCDEACFVIAIASLTPRQFYTQGNEFYMTDVKTMDDLHKPGMDGIGFQDLIGERMAYFDTKISAGGTSVEHRSKIGKLPAWIEYMTAVNKAYGDFADTEGAGFMILNRNYDMDTEDEGQILDATTYIDPSKYNYAFADVNLEAQNFWVMIDFKITARRLMSARLIPSV